MNRPTSPPRAAVLFIAFNREDTTRQVFQAIRQARPPRLYFACDGPRNPEESVRCEAVRAIVQDVDWPCEVHTRFLDKNHGIRRGVSGALDWFFGMEERGIILEDDTLPVPSFFGYCEELLERYQDDERIWMIQGSNLMTEWPARDRHSYWFSTHGYGAPWGWASWRRAWAHYDVDMQRWPELRNDPMFNAHFLNATEKHEAHFMFHHTHTGEIHSWSYQMDLQRILQRAVNIIPTRSLIRNIGFGLAGTNTLLSRDKRDKSDQKDLELPLKHPDHFMVDEARDMAYFDRYINVWSTPGKRFRSIFRRTLPTPLVDRFSTWMLRLRTRHER